VYVVGPEGSGKALLGVYDIFGFWPQTLQGADILSKSLKCQVFVPDFFAPDEPYDLARFPPSTDEDKAAFQKFFGGPANPERVLPMVHKVAEAIKATGAAKIGVRSPYGYCWGGKITTLSGATDDFVGVAALHPAMLSAGDADALKVPIAVFPSKDEPVDEYENLLKAISSKPFAAKNSYKLYDTMHHGWAAARADLKDAENLKQYEDVYQRLAGFFSELI
ncbi:hypothetical protein EXIGLDRAFT_735034, partial [Exidia glandulosa HHB12029]